MKLFRKVLSSLGLSGHVHRIEPTEHTETINEIDECLVIISHLSGLESRYEPKNYYRKKVVIETISLGHLQQMLRLVNNSITGEGEGRYIPIKEYNECRTSKVTITLDDYLADLDGQWVDLYTSLNEISEALTLLKSHYVEESELKDYYKPTINKTLGLIKRFINQL